MSLRVRTGILTVLSVFFLVYSVTLYTSGEGREPAIAEGRLVWQKYNCQACHQLYGLGGYLGPDLTHIGSAPGKGEAYIRALVQAGTKQMPSYPMRESELKAIVGFLKSIDATGDGRIGGFQLHWNGMISEHDERR
ncbi:MAG: cytochrome c [Bacteroidia bacterium]